jgi:hypothetical protein
MDFQTDKSQTFHPVCSSRYPELADSPWMDNAYEYPVQSHPRLPALFHNGLAATATKPFGSNQNEIPCTSGTAQPLNNRLISTLNQGIDLLDYFFYIAPFQFYGFF